MTTTTKTTKEMHTEAMKQIAQMADGTYNLLTAEAVDFSEGYQVTFCQVGDNYSDEAYDLLVALFLKLSADGVVYLGKFDGDAEISFHFDSKDLAVHYAEKYNQVSIWDWSACDEIKTGGTGRH